MELYDYQTKLLNDLNTAIQQGYKRICCVSPTGSGKTIMIREFVRRLNNQFYSCFLVPSRILVSQSVKAFREINLSFGKLHGNSQFYEGFLSWVSTIDTFRARKKQGKITQEFTFFIIDECHHARAATYEELMKTLFPNAYYIGFTATPVRLDNKGLGASIDNFKSFEIIIFGPSMKYLLDRGKQGLRGSLSPYTYIKPPSITDNEDLKKKLRQHGYKNADEALGSGAFIGDLISSYQKYGAPQKLPGITFCNSVEISKHFAKKYNEAGIRAAHIDAKTPTRERDKILNGLVSGLYQQVCSKDVISEGCDVPACSIVTLARYTESLSLNVQQIGRPIRFVPGKQAYVLDLVNRYQTFGRPEQITQEKWRDYFYGSAKDITVPTYVCKEPSCRSCFDPTEYTRCPDCNKPVEYKPSSSINSSASKITKRGKEEQKLINAGFTGIDIDLVEVSEKPEPEKRLTQDQVFELYKQEFLMCQSKEDIREVLKAHGLKMELAKMFYEKLLKYKMKELAFS